MKRKPKKTIKYEPFNNRPILIVGPCAAEDKNQILFSIKEAKKRPIDFLRISLWKPRTKPGFDGIGEEGIELLTLAAQHGVYPATEVVLPVHVEKIMEQVLPKAPTTKILVWIGARNQNHYIQQEIARIASCDDRMYLMVKNQPWSNYEHWEGIIEHVLEGGIKKDHLLICHRGFAPLGYENPNGYRNVPDYEMSEKLKDQYQLPIVFDPSHTGGSVENVFKIAQEAANRFFDGLIVEVHPNPKNAKTDSKQQITWDQFDKLSKSGL